MALDGLDTLKAKGVVKSVQSGYQMYLDVPYESTKRISIATVDASKSILLYTVAETLPFYTQVKLENNSIAVSRTTSTSKSEINSFNWQVIEFY